MRTKKSILLVDDDPLIGDFLSFILEMNGYIVYQAHSAYEAMPVLIEKHVDLCLSDVQMPRINGYQLCERIRELYSTVKVLLMTADFSPVVRKKARMSGAEDCFSKDITPDMLIAKIRNLLEEHAHMVAGVA